MLLRVTNRNSFTLTDRYDGVDYKFEPNKPTVIEEAAARHFFGYGMADKSPFLVRQGWSVSSDRMEEAMKKLNKFVFEQGSVEFSPADDEVEEIAEEESPDIVKLQSKVKKIAVRQDPIKSM